MVYGLVAVQVRTRTAVRLWTISLPQAWVISDPRVAKAFGESGLGAYIAMAI